MSRRKIILFSILGLLLIWMLYLSYSQFVYQKQRALQASEDLKECSLMVQKIKTLRHRPTLATERERLSDEITGLVERMALSAGLGADIVRITHEPAQRIGDSAYTEKPTRITVRKTRLRRLVTLLHGLTRGEHGLRAQTLRLSPNRPDEDADSWDAEFVVTYLIYDPPTNKK